MTSSEIHELLLDAVEDEYKKKGFIISRPYGSHKGGGVVIDLLAFHPLSKECYCFEALTNPSEKLLNEKGKKYSPYGEVIFVVLSKPPVKGYRYKIVDLGPHIEEAWMLKYSKVFSALGSKYRIKLLLLLRGHDRTYMVLKTSLGLIAGHFDHHLKTLLSRGFVEKAENGKYKITDFGKSVVEAFRKVTIKN